MVMPRLYTNWFQGREDDKTNTYYRTFRFRATHRTTGKTKIIDKVSALEIEEAKDSRNIYDYIEKKQSLYSRAVPWKN